MNRIPLSIRSSIRVFMIAALGYSACISLASAQDIDDDSDGGPVIVYTSHHHHYHHPYRHAVSESVSRPATGHSVFIFNPNALRWTVYGPNGNLIRSGHGVGGRSYCPDLHRGCKTPIGTFHIYGKEGPSYKSGKFPVGEGGAPMPWAMFFYHGFAVHGSYEVPNYNASHGCIRLYPSDARWLNQNILGYGSTVIVKPY